MAEEMFTFDVPARVLMSDRPIPPSGEIYRAMAQAAVEAVLDGRDGYSVHGVRKDGIGYVRVTVPHRVAEAGGWLWRRSVL